MNESEMQRHGNVKLTSREVVAAEVADRWIASHPHVEVTAVDLTKTLQQLITELFLTGGRRQRQELSAHAVSVLDVIGVRPDQFAPVRTFAKAADMPLEYGVMAGEVAAVLLPLAAAVQLARIPVTNTAVRMIGPSETIDRRRLRGFVVGHIRPHAQNIHSRVGAGASVEEYLRLILADVDHLAAAVVTSARAKDTRPTRLTNDAAERAQAFVRTHIRALMNYAAGRFGPQADDVVGTAMIKLAVQFRNDPSLSAGIAYGRTVVDSVAVDMFNALRARQEHEVCNSEVLERQAQSASALDRAGEDCTNVLLDMVLAAAKHLAAKEHDPDANAARATLLHYFLADPREFHPRKALLADRALQLVCSDTQTGIATELGELAAALSAVGERRARVVTLALDALRAQAKRLSD